MVTGGASVVSVLVSLHVHAQVVLVAQLFPADKASRVHLRVAAGVLCFRFGDTWKIDSEACTREVFLSKGLLLFKT